MTIKNIVYIFTAFIDAYLAYSICDSILNRRTARKYMWIGYFLLFPLTILLLNTLVAKTFTRVLLGSLFNVFCAIIWFKGDNFVKVYSGALFASILFVGDIFIYGIILFFYPTYLHAPSDDIFVTGSISFYIYIAIITLIFRRFPLKILGRLSGMHGVLLVIMPLVSASIITILINFFKEKEINVYYIYLIPALFFMLLLAFIVMLFKAMATATNKAHLEAILNAQIDSIMSRYEALENAYNSVNALRHDWRNHTIMLDNLIQQAKWKELTKYVQDSKNLINQDDLPHTGNATIDVLLGNLIKRANLLNITLDTDIHLPTGITIGRADLCVLLGNAFDNAIEACEHANSGDRYIRVKMNVKHPYLYIDIENAISIHPHMKNNKYITVKKDSKSHGLGLINMEAIIRKYNGYISLKHTDKSFSVRCILMNPLTDDARKTTDHALKKP